MIFRQRADFMGGTELTRLRLVLAAMLLALAGPAASETPRLVIAAQTSGTVNWELQTILRNGLDRANGFELVVMDVAGSPAAQVAFQGGEADVIVSDWIWVARQKAEGADIAFLPYSRAVGGIMVPGDSEAQSLADLAGAKIGIAGGPLDKSWLILRARAAMDGLDLEKETEQVFGAPPLIYQTGLAGDLGATVNFWHFMAKQEAAGMRLLMSVDEAAADLGLDPDLPLLGYVVRESLVAENPELVEGLAGASRQAKDLLAESDAEWELVRPQMNAETDAEFEALKAGFRAGIPGDEPVDEASASAMLELMARLGGGELVGQATTLPAGVFVQPGS